MSILFNNDCNSTKKYSIEPVLRMTGITKDFSGVRVLHGVDFNVRRGEVMALMGENGAGKSTLMKVLAGVYSDWEGSISTVMRDGYAVDVREMGDVSRDDLIRLMVGRDIDAFFVPKGEPGDDICSRFLRSAVARETVSGPVSRLAGLLVAAGFFAWGYYQVSGGFSTTAVLLIVPGVGAALGALNGLVIAKGRIQPFIVTLGTMSAAVGLAKFITGKGGQIHTIYYEAADYSAEGTAHIAPKSFDILNSNIPLIGVRIFPVTGLFFLASVLIMYFVLTRLRYGRYIYAIGGNEETSRLSGIDVDRVKIVTYAFSGGLAALAGILYCSAYTQGKADAGITWELDAIAAVVIGGTSLMGGRGSVIGTMVGVLILGYLSNILNLQEVSSEVQDILKGVIIVGAVLLQEGMVARWIRALRRLKRSPL